MIKNKSFTMNNLLLKELLLEITQQQLRDSVQKAIDSKTIIKTLYLNSKSRMVQIKKPKFGYAITILENNENIITFKSIQEAAVRTYKQINDNVLCHNHNKDILTIPSFLSSNTLISYILEEPKQVQEYLLENYNHIPDCFYNLKNEQNYSPTYNIVVDYLIFKNVQHFFNENNLTTSINLFNLISNPHFEKIICLLTDNEKSMLFNSIKSFFNHYKNMYDKEKKGQISIMLELDIFKTALLKLDKNKIYTNGPNEFIIDNNMYLLKFPTEHNYNFSTLIDIDDINIKTLSFYIDRICINKKNSSLYFLSNHDMYKDLIHIKQLLSTDQKIDKNKKIIVSNIINKILLN